MTTKSKDTTCCNHDCNQGRTCPVRLGTHKPAEAVHQISEPQPAHAVQNLPSDDTEGGAA